MFFCSICYKAEELRIRNTTTSHELISGSASHEQNGQDELNAVGSKKPSNPGRCFQCNKKIEFLVLSVAVIILSVPPHRQYNKHNCTFDFKSHSREALSKANPAVIADKIEKVKLTTFFKFAKSSFKI